MITLITILLILMIFHHGWRQTLYISSDLMIHQIPLLSSKVQKARNNFISTFFQIYISTKHITLIFDRELFDIEMMAQKGLKGNYNFKVETKGKIDIFGTELASETSRWVKALKKAKQTHEEAMRTKDEKLYRNVDGFLDLFRKKQLD